MSLTEESTMKSAQHCHRHQLVEQLAWVQRINSRALVLPTAHIRVAMATMSAQGIHHTLEIEVHLEVRYRTVASIKTTGLVLLRLLATEKSRETDDLHGRGVQSLGHHLRRLQTAYDMSFLIDRIRVDPHHREDQPQLESTTATETHTSRITPTAHHHHDTAIMVVLLLMVAGVGLEIMAIETVIEHQTTGTGSIGIATFDELVAGVLTESGNESVGSDYRTASETCTEDRMLKCECRPLLRCSMLLWNRSMALMTVLVLEVGRVDARPGKVSSRREHTK